MSKKLLRVFMVMVIINLVCSGNVFSKCFRDFPGAIHQNNIEVLRNVITDVAFSKAQALEKKYESVTTDKDRLRLFGSKEHVEVIIEGETIYQKLPLGQLNYSYDLYLEEAQTNKLLEAFLLKSSLLKDVHLPSHWQPVENKYFYHFEFIVDSATGLVVKKGKSLLGFVEARLTDACL